MNDLTPTRSLLIALGDERRTMREGYAFLDEKCLLLAGEMLRQFRLHQVISNDLAGLLGSARRRLPRLWRVTDCTGCRWFRRRRRINGCASTGTRCSAS